MPAIILPLFFCLLLLLFNQYKKIDWRYAFILSSLFTCGILVALTEILSKVMLFSFPYLFSSWIICTLILVTYILISRSIEKNTIIKILTKIYKAIINNKLSLLILISILINTLVIALVSPPNTFDSMTYHMSRVAHWIQNKSVDFYPTSIFRQLVSAPLSEYIIANFMILYGNDRLANLVQWLSMAGSIIVVSAIAGQLGATKAGQLIASIVCATLPMGILQSTSTQNDYVVGFWLLVFVYCVLAWVKQKTLLIAISIGMSYGLAVLTKPTAYIYALPFVIYLIWNSVKKASIKNILYLTTSLFIIMLLNSNHLIRNYQSFGTPIAQSLDSGHYSYENEIIRPSVTISNLARNTGLHLENHNRFDKIFQYAIEQMHTLLDIEINDERTTWPEYKFKVQGALHHEDYAGNYYHTILIILLLLFYILFGRKNNTITIYITLLTVSYLIFSTYLRWQPWHSRLQLPLFLMWAPFIGYALRNFDIYKVKEFVIFEFPYISKHFPSLNKVIYKIQEINIKSIFIVLLFYSCLPAIFNSVSKPVFTENNIFNTERNEQLYFANPNFKDNYLTISKLIKDSQCKKIALAGFGNVWEYPLWNFSPKNIDDPIQIEHISTNYKIPNKVISENNRNFVPCGIVSVSSITDDSIRYMNKTYTLTFSGKYLKLFLIQ